MSSSDRREPQTPIREPITALSGTDYAGAVERVESGSSERLKSRSGNPPGNRFPLLRSGEPDYGRPRHADQVRARRDATVKRSTTRYGTNRFLHSPFWLVTIDWPDERCPTCCRPLDDTDAAYDEDEQACFCFTCASKWLKTRDEPEPPPPRPIVARTHPQLELDL